MNRTKTWIALSVVCLTVCQVSCAREVPSDPEVSVSVENGCDQEIEAAYVKFGEKRTIGGTLLPKKSATEGGLPFPVILDEVEVHYRHDGQDLKTTIPLKSLVPEGIEGDFEVLFTILCADGISVETTFWQYVHDGKRYRKVRVK